MIVKSPLKKNRAKPNRRKPAGRAKNGSATNGTATGNSYGKRINKKEKKSRVSLPSVKPWKIILAAFVLGALGVLYLNHVFATQKLLQQVQQLEQQYNRAKRMNEDYRLTYDRMIGPAEIYNKAKAKGFINGGPAEKVITVEGDNK